MIQVKRFYAHNDLRNYSYLILDEKTGDSWAIDPFEAGPMIEYIKKASLSLHGILNTHQHFDHVRGNAPLQDAFGSPIRKLKGGERVSLGEGHELETIDSPGHTLDHQVFAWRAAGEVVALFSGDTLFNAGVGNCKGGGDVDLLYQTVNALLSRLPPTTRLYPGHDYLERNLKFAAEVEPDNIAIRDQLKGLEGPEDRRDFTLGEERRYNPFFRLGSEEIRERLLGTKDLADEGAVRRDLFRKLRSLRDNW